MRLTKLFKKFRNPGRLYYKIDLYIYRNYVSSKIRLLIIPVFLIVFLSVSACHIDTSPEQIYGIRGKIMNLAESLKGIRYTYGGTDIYGFDCSGFVSYVFDSFGVKIPRTAKSQRKAGKKIKLNRAKNSDIIIFKLEKSWHSGILKKTKKNISFIHAPNKRGSVREEKLTGYWLKKIKYIVRVL